MVQRSLGLGAVGVGVVFMIPSIVYTIVSSFAEALVTRMGYKPVGPSPTSSSSRLLHPCIHHMRGPSSIPRRSRASCCRLSLTPAPSSNPLLVYVYVGVVRRCLWVCVWCAWPTC